MWSKVFIVFINAFFPVLINTIGGVRSTDRDLLRAARAYCASDWQIFTTIVIPAPCRSFSPASGRRWRSG
jgi:NitT/TauT family transport system permease protein